jgi:uncharacterized membrane protein
MMKRTKIFLGIISVASAVAVLSSSCANNKKDVLYSCDSTNVSYSKTVKVVLENNCYSCHSTANSSSVGGGIVLDNHDAVFNFIDTTTGADGGTLLNDIKHTGNAMPKPPASKLRDCDIAKIAHWISEGGKDN